VRPIDCTRCGNRVLVEKYSPEHTGVQWLDDAQAACTYFAQLAASGDNRLAASGCPSLHESIDAEVREGRLPITRRTVPVRGRPG
jgi:hypothetical protein